MAIQVIFELKGCGQKIYTADDYRRSIDRGGDLSKQAKRIVEFDDIITNGTVEIGDYMADLVVTDLPVTSYHKELCGVLTGCINQSICGRFVNKILYVQATQPNKVSDYYFPFKSGRGRLYFSSLETLSLEDDEPFRSRIPYSSYPLEEEMILKLLSGEIILETYLNLNVLKKYIKKNGWKVTLLKTPIETINDYKKIISGMRIFPHDVQCDIMLIRKGACSLPINLLHLSNIYEDFLKPSIITDSALLLKKETEQRRNSGAYGIYYKKEKDIWI